MDQLSQVNENKSKNRNGNKRASIGPICIVFGANSNGNVIENRYSGIGDDNDDDNVEIKVVKIVMM